MKLILFAIGAAAAAQYLGHQHGLLKRAPMKKFVKGLPNRVGIKISKSSHPALQNQEIPTLPTDQKKSLQTIPDTPPDVKGSLTVVAGERGKGDKNTYGFVRTGKVDKATEYIGARPGHAYKNDFVRPDKLSLGVEAKNGDAVRASVRAQKVKVKMEIPKGSTGTVSYRDKGTDPFTYEQYTYKDSPVRRVLRGKDGGTISGVGQLEGAGRIRTSGQMDEPSIA